MSRFLSPGTMTILILAILGGLVGAYAIRSLLNVPPTPPAEGPSPILVPLASNNLPAGRTIVLEDIALFSMSPTELANQPWDMNRVMTDSDQVIGRTLKTAISAGQPFLTTTFYLAGEGPSILEKLPEGFRAVSVQVPFERGGFVSPGTIVDILFRSTASPEDDNTPPIPEMTITLVERAEVLGRPGRSGTSRDQSSVVVLAVSPEDARNIDAVRDHGEFTLLSRPPGDVDFGGPPPPTSLQDVLGIEPLAELPPEPAAAPAVTEIYRRGSRQVNAFEYRDNRYVPASNVESL